VLLILCFLICILLFVSFNRTAFGSDVAENAMSVPVVNDSVDTATGDHCIPGVTAPVIEVELENCPYVKMEADETDMEYPEISVKVSDYAFHI